ncbi:hypothetical protein D3C73_1476830 [compost metagenome]
MLAVDRAKGVVNIRAVGPRQGNQLISEGAALGVILTGFAGIEANVFQDEYFAVLETGRELLRGVPHRVVGQLDLEVRELRQAGRSGLE